MGERNRRRGWAAAAAVWGGLALLLWGLRMLATGFDSLPDDAFAVRNEELAALFAQNGKTAEAKRADADVGRNVEEGRTPKPSADGASPHSASDGELEPKPPQSSSAPPEPGSAPGSGTSGDKGADRRIDINRATAAELDKLPGIGPSKAKAIVEYRESHGPFRSTEELKRIKGIGDKTYESLKPLVIAGPEAS